jgi:dTDP-4-amino-4,6-dideoxygalactose transaminase
MMEKSKKNVYEQWPIGKVPKKFQRPEIDALKDAGYVLNDARDAITIFEDKVAKYAGSKYAVAVDSCTNSLFLCLKYLEAKGEITMPCRTWLSAPLSVLHAGCSVKFSDFEWSGCYKLDPYPVYDSAVRFTEGMYIPDSYQCLSFQIKKRLPIGKGGMVLTDDKEGADWIRCASYEGRHIETQYNNDKIEMAGWNMYMTPEDAARGILIFDQLDKVNPDVCNSSHYCDVSRNKVFEVDSNK